MASFSAVLDHIASSEEELVIALAGAVGTQLELMSLELRLALRAYDVDADEISLSAGLLRAPGVEDLPARPYDERLDAYMRAGSSLRQRWQRGDALALLALPEIRTRRSAAPHRVAHILRSLKHPEEVRSLRAIYGERFFLVSAYRPRAERLSALRSLIDDSQTSSDPEDWSFLPEDLLDRDEHETEEFGQRLRDTFHLADFFVDGSSREQMRPQLERFLALIFGDPFRTPSRDEYALACAEVAGLRSAELGRQVGACLTAHDGDIIALGTNEVPKANGGLYWEDDDGDAREFHRGSDTNDARKREIADDIAQRLSARKLLDASVSPSDSAAVLDTMLASRLGELTEFGRAVHAEMAALLDAGRRGVSTQGAKLYSTTFPCHNCARHLIAAGVSEVVYVAPYAKSQAFRLHADAVVVAAANPPKNRLHLRPFVGVAPRIYGRVFAAGDRKNRSGHIVPFEPHTASLILPSAAPEFRPDVGAHVTREGKALDVLNRLMSEPAPAVPDDPTTYDD